MVFTCDCGYKSSRIDIYKRHVKETHNGEKIKCDRCDSMVTSANLARHKKTNKCLNAQINQNNAVNDSSEHLHTRITHDSNLIAETQTATISSTNQLKIYLVTRKDGSIVMVHDDFKIGDISLVLNGKI